MMNSLHDSLKFKETLDCENGVLRSNHISGRMIGDLEINEYDPMGNLVFSSKDTNDITIAGSTFILEQMFKTPSQNNRFNLTGFDNFPEVPTSDELNNSNILKEERIFGFMVGIGGEDAVSVVAPSYKTTSLSKFIPFRLIKKDDTTSSINKNNYALSKTVQIDNDTYTGYYVKLFDETADIIPEYVNGSGVVGEDINVTDSPIYTYAKLILSIDTQDIREYFRSTYGSISDCRINQLGLVAGRPPLNSNSEYTDVRLVTTVNFKGRDLSNDENIIKFRYKIYCL